MSRSRFPEAWILEPPSLAWRGAPPPLPRTDGRPSTEDEVARISGGDFVGRKRDAAQMGGDIDEVDPRLMELVESVGDACSLFRHCRDGNLDLRKMVRDAVGGKARSTVAGRVGALRLYERWAADFVAEGSWPLTVKKAYLYVRGLRDDDRAPATRASSFLEALGFAHGTLGLDGALDAHGAPQVMGAATAAFDRKRPRVQDVPYTVDAVKYFENLVFEGDTVSECIFAGFVSFCLHSRSRCADAVRLAEEPWLDVTGEGDEEFGYVEAGALTMKTGRSKNRRRRPFPVVGHCSGVGGRAWAKRWLELRVAEGLDASTDGFLMLAPLADGGWARGGLRTDEANTWAKSLLRRGGFESTFISKTGTHSWKATMLSWCAKAGVREGLRRRLGGHAKPKDKSVLDYSRDALAPALRVLWRVIGWVRAGRFDPDATRSGRWTGFPEGGGADKIEKEIEEAVDSQFIAGAVPDPTEPELRPEEVPSAGSGEVFPVAGGEAAGGEPRPEVVSGHPAERRDDGDSDAGPVAEATPRSRVSSTCSDVAETEAPVGEGGNFDADEGHSSDATVDAREIPVSGLFEHVDFGTLHVGRDGVRDTGDCLKCYRPLVKYRRLDEWPLAKRHLCRTCFS